MSLVRDCWHFFIFFSVCELVREQWRLCFFLSVNARLEALHVVHEAPLLCR